MSDVIMRLRQLAELYPFLAWHVDAAIAFTERNELRRGLCRWGVGEAGELPYLQVSEHDLLTHVVGIGSDADYFSDTYVKMMAGLIPDCLRQECWRIEERSIVVTGYLSKYHGLTVIRLQISASYPWGASIEQFGSLYEADNHSDYCPDSNSDVEIEDGDCYCEPPSLGIRHLVITQGDSLDSVAQHFTQFLEGYL